MNTASRARNAPASTWRIRRRIIFGTLGFCALTVVWCLAAGDDTRVAETAVLSAFALAGATIGSYVFGAAWEDIRGRDAGFGTFGVTGDPGGQP